MFHVKRLIAVFIVSFSSILALSQGSITVSQREFTYQHTPDSSILNRLSATEGYKSLTKSEKETVYWINYIRINPQQFSKDILIPFLKQFPETKGSYSNSLIKQLQKMSPSPFIIPEKRLNDLALSHSSDLGKSGSSISHSSSSGSSFQQRMNKAGFTECIAENIFEGRQDALQTILFLLIDRGVPNVGHRKNILDPSMLSVGVSYYSIKGKTGYFFYVQNFSCSATQ